MDSATPLPTYCAAGLDEIAALPAALGSAAGWVAEPFADEWSADERYRALFENAIEGIFQTSPDGHYLTANSALARIYGYDNPRELIAGLRDIAHELYVQPGRREEFVELMNRDGQVTDFESEVRRKDGSIIWISENSRTVRDRKGAVLYYEGTVIDISRRKRAEADLEVAQNQLVEAARRDGMAEIATGVLHNVGNVLNSVNVSATVVAEHVRKLRVEDLTKVCDLLDQHSADLDSFLAGDARGRQIPSFLRTLSGLLVRQRQAVVEEIDLLVKNIDHIKTIVAMQQSYAGACGVSEQVSLGDLLDDALHMNVLSLERHGIKIVREYHNLPKVLVDKQRLMQILVNLVKNAKDSVVEHNPPGRRITLRAFQQGNLACIEVADNGVGIPPENLTRIFSHGFTTKRNGHGFGLHSCANGARQLGGELTAASAGPGMGATFRVSLRLDGSEEAA